MHAAAESQRALGLLAKRPVAGSVKTRLAADTSPEWAARVASAFLHDMTARLAAFPAQRVLAYCPVDAQGYFTEVVAGRFRLEPQGDGDLGRRVAGFFERRLREGALAAVLLGTDSPTLPLDFIEQAFAELQRADLVLGPATDGGYYLIGCRRQVPPIFAGIDWGSDRVLAQTIARLKESRSGPALLAPWYDVDTLADWHVLGGHLAALRAAGIDPGLPKTRELMTEPRQGDPPCTLPSC